MKPPNANEPGQKYTMPPSDGPPSTTEISPQENPQPLLFFNYHEFLLNEYTSCAQNGAEPASETGANQKTAIVINHFPNCHAPRDSGLYRSTRVVRIPRQFDVAKFADLVPQFSTFVPGDEPAAIRGDGDHVFVAAGEFDASVFGQTSATPLVPHWVSASELTDIVTRVNAYLNRTASPLQRLTWLDNALDFFSATLYSRLFTNNVRNTHMKRTIGELEKYVDSVNNMLAKRDPRLALVSPVKSAFLSLDFQIPNPEADMALRLRESDRESAMEAKG